MEEEKKPKVNYRIGMFSSVVLICIAGFFDILTLIPGLGDILGIVFWTIASVYLYTKGVGMFSGKKIATSAISFVVELIPAIQALPALTAGIIAVLLIIRIEDKTGMSIVKPMKKGVTPPRYKRVPKNNEQNIRRPNNVTEPNFNQDGDNIIRPNFNQDNRGELDMAA